MNGLKMMLAGFILLLPVLANADTVPVEIDQTIEEVLPVPDQEPTMVTLGKIEENAPVVIEPLVPFDDINGMLVSYLTKAKDENVRRASMRRSQLNDIECLALAMYHEARGEGERGMKAVAFVIHNRVKSTMFPKDYCNVILQPSQFSFTSDRLPDNIKQWNMFEKALAISISLLHNGGFERERSPVGSALFFHSFSSPSKWAYARSRKFIATIGNHHFFK